MSEQILFWVGFNVVVLVLICLDAFYLHRKAHVIQTKEALSMSAFWILLALGFNVYIYFWKGPESAINFLAGYLVEKSLSIDNLFVFSVIFSYFKVPKHLIHTVLTWGLIGAILMRALFIVGGLALIQNFHWLVYIFGFFLVATGIKLWSKEENQVHPEKNICIRIFGYFFPISHEYEKDAFFVRRAGQLFATPLFLAVLAVETTDIIFAIDSIPAIIGITQDPFIVYTSNILAILGLRSLYFALSHYMGLFYYLQHALACILMFIGIKMVVSGYIQIPIMFSLSLIFGILIMATILSVIRNSKR